MLPHSWSLWLLSLSFSSVLHPSWCHFYWLHLGSFLQFLLLHITSQLLTHIPKWCLHTSKLYPNFHQCLQCIGFDTKFLGNWILCQDFWFKMQHNRCCCTPFFVTHPGHPMTVNNSVILFKSSCIYHIQYSISNTLYWKSSVKWETLHLVII